jgi:uncharacterized protein (DUF1778 family)
MKPTPATAEVNIRLRARAEDKALIDQAAELVGTDRSQFMLASAIEEANKIILDQSIIYADAKAFQTIMDWMDQPPTSSESTRMKRILQANTPWDSD